MWNKNPDRRKRLNCFQFERDSNKIRKQRGRPVISRSSGLHVSLANQGPEFESVEVVVLRSSFWRDLDWMTKPYNKTRQGYPKRADMTTWDLPSPFIVLYIKEYCFQKYKNTIFYHAFSSLGSSFFTSQLHPSVRSVKHGSDVGSRLACWLPTCLEQEERLSC